MMERSVKMVLALILIIILTAVIAYAVLPYKNYFFSAFVLFVIFRPLYHLLRKRARFGRSLASIFVIVISIFVVLIPLYFLLSIIVSETQQLLTDQESITASIKAGNQLFTSFLSHLKIPQESLQTKIEDRVMGFVSEVVSFTSRFILGSIQGLSQQFVGLTIMYSCSTIFLQERTLPSCRKSLQQFLSMKRTPPDSCRSSKQLFAQPLFQAGLSPLSREGSLPSFSLLRNSRGFSLGLHCSNSFFSARGRGAFCLGACHHHPAAPAGLCGRSRDLYRRARHKHGGQLPPARHPE